MMDGSGPQLPEYDWQKDAIDSFHLCIAMKRQRLLLSGGCEPANEAERLRLYLSGRGP